ncbi:MAG: tRNA (adenosine(37)-N6)-threonylcarbamoyltransferase complex ATPase subunit type 1 TsaE [Sulfurovum sp.]
MKKEYLLTLNELETLSKDLIKNFEDKDLIVILRGDLASGKTTLVKNIVRSLDIDEVVTSPTFSLQSIYSDTIFHYDVYNKTIQEFIALGMLEEFEKQGIHFVEWGDEKLQDLLEDYGFEVMVINIEKKDDKRQYIIEA